MSGEAQRSLLEPTPLWVDGVLQQVPERLPVADKPFLVFYGRPQVTAMTRSRRSERVPKVSFNGRWGEILPEGWLRSPHIDSVSLSDMEEPHGTR